MVGGPAQAPEFWCVPRDSAKIGGLAPQHLLCAGRMRSQEQLQGVSMGLRDAEGSCAAQLTFGA